MATFDTSLFFAAFGAGLSVILALLIARDFIQSIAARLFILLLLVAVTYLFHQWIPEPLHGYSFVVQSAAPALFWMCCRITFVDPDEPRYLLWPVAFYSFLAPLLFLVIGKPDFLTFSLKGLPQWFEYLLILAGFWEVVSNWNNDLVEARRRLRGGIMLGVGTVVAWCIVSFNFHIGGAASRYLAIDMAIIVLAWMLLQGRPELWSLIHKKTAATISKTANKLAENNPETQKIDSQNQDELRKLQQLMNKGFYRQESLTLAMLAKQLDTPEYRLRSTINQALNYNNFNEYINVLRIGEAAERLIKEPDTPVTNIALDVGYRTMSSFNRAFKKIHNNTPSDFRESGGTP